MIVVLLKVGKIFVLKEIVNGIIENYLEVELIVLLIDECLEEVMDLEWSVKGDVVFFIFDL